MIRIAVLFVALVNSSESLKVWQLRTPLNIKRDKKEDDFSPFLQQEKEDLDASEKKTARK